MWFSWAALLICCWMSARSEPRLLGGFISRLTEQLRAAAWSFSSMTRSTPPSTSTCWAHTTIYSKLTLLLTYTRRWWALQITDQESGLCRAFAGSGFMAEPPQLWHQHNCNHIEQMEEWSIGLSGGLTLLLWLNWWKTLMQNVNSPEKIKRNSERPMGLASVAAVTQVLEWVFSSECRWFDPLLKCLNNKLPLLAVPSVCLCCLCEQVDTLLSYLPLLYISFGKKIIIKMLMRESQFKHKLYSI